MTGAAILGWEMPSHSSYIPAIIHFPSQPIPERYFPLFWPTYACLQAATGENDDLMSVEIVRHGLDQGLIPANHLNEVGQLFGHGDQGFYVGIASDHAAG